MTALAAKHEPPDDSYRAIPGLPGHFLSITTGDVWRRKDNRVLHRMYNKRKGERVRVWRWFILGKHYSVTTLAYMTLPQGEAVAMLRSLDLPEGQPSRGRPRLHEQQDTDDNDTDTIVEHKPARLRNGRRCHDCGKPTTDYRCAECWGKLRSPTAASSYLSEDDW